MPYKYLIAAFTSNRHGVIGARWAGLHNIDTHILRRVAWHLERLLDKLVFSLAHELPHLLGDVLHVRPVFMCHIANRFMGLIIYVNARHNI